MIWENRLNGFHVHLIEASICLTFYFQVKNEALVSSRRVRVYELAVINLIVNLCF